MATWEEARLCPKCSVPGREVSTQPARVSGSKVVVLQCDNDRCSWHETQWIVQVLKDGSIPVRKPGAKEFPELDMYQEAAARRYLEDTVGEQDIGPERPSGS
jgi:hypothetical protein